MKRIAFTICNYGYLFYALECERSFVEHHPRDWSFYIVLVDHPRLSDIDLAKVQGLLSSPQSRVVAISSLFQHSKEVSSMSLYYDITEYSTSIKPWVFAYFFSELSPQSTTYIDPDIQFFGSLDPGQINGPLPGTDCVVTPHVLTNSLNAIQHPTLQNIRSCGSYNFGFVHFENTLRSRRIIDFWKQQLVYNSLNWLEENLFTDQRYGDIFPSMCCVWVNRNPALNVAYWNTQERLVHTSDDGTIQVRLHDSTEADERDHPLVFFHFSGLKPHGYIGISKYGGRDPRSPRGANKTIERLINRYDNLVRAHQGRLHELSLNPESDLIGSVAYEANGQMQIYALKPQERRDLNRFFAERANAGMAMLPPSRFVDEKAFLMALHGISQPTLSRVLCPEFNTFGALGFHIPGIEFFQEQRDTTLPESRFAELNVVGYPNFSFGVGRITGLILRGLSRAGLAFSFTVDPAKAMPILEDDLAWVDSLPGLSQFNPDAPTFFLINADQLLHYVNTGVASQYFSRVCNLGYWWWELEAPVPAHADAAVFLDKILAPTQFIFESLGRVIPKHKLQYAPLDYRELFDAIVSGSLAEESSVSDQDFLYGLGLDLNLAQYKSLTLSVIDFRSCIHRKNPDLMVDIFSEATMRDHALILKSSGGTKFVNQYLELIERVSVLANVFLLDRRLSEADLRRLFSVCQVYASPHRSEGLGLNIIEADAYGLATVFTDYGGITDYPFYGKGQYHPCPYKLVKISASSEVYRPHLETLSEEVYWAEPDRIAFESSLRECVAEGRRAKAESSIRNVVPSASVMDVLTNLLHAGFNERAAYHGRCLPRRPEELRAPAALAVAPTLADGKRQLYLACRQLLLVSRQGIVALRHLLNVVKLVVWLMLRQRRGLRRLYWAIVARRQYLRRPPSFRKLDVPPP